MTSFQGGTDSGYLSIGSYRLNTRLFEDEYEFISGEPSTFTIQNNKEKKILYDLSNGFVPSQKNDNISIMEKNSECHPFLNFIIKNKLLKNLSVQSEYTLFIPIDEVEVLDKIVKNYGEIVIPENLLKYHIVNYTILPIQLLDQILRIETKLKNQYITIKNCTMMTYHDEINLFEDNKILKYIKSDNGSIYFIKRPIVHDIYNYL